MFGLGVPIEALQLRLALRTTFRISLRGFALQPGRFGRRDAGTIFADRVHGDALKLRLRHAAENLVKIAIKTSPGRFILLGRHNTHTGLVSGAPPPTLIP